MKTGVSMVDIGRQCAGGSGMGQSGAPGPRRPGGHVWAVGCAVAHRPGEMSGALAASEAGGCTCILAEI